MISDDQKIEQFISDHRWAVLTTMRGAEPVSSVIAYARDQDQLVVSTPGTTFKTRSIHRDPHVNLCIISNKEPFSFVAIEGLAEVQSEGLVEDTLRVFDNIREVGYEAPADLPQWLETQKRVILRITPGRVHAVIR